MTNKKIYNRVRRTGIGGTIVFIILFSTLVTLCMLVAVQQFIKYVLDTKLSAEYEDMERMAGLLDNADPNSDDVYALLDMYNRDYIVCDSAGNVLKITGQDTREPKAVIIDVNQYTKGVTAYADKELAIVYPKESGRVGLKPREFMRWIVNDVMRAEGIDSIRDANEKLIFTENGTVIGGALPVWLTVNAKDGRALICKELISVKIRDLEAVAIVAFLISVVVIFLVGSLIFRTVLNVIRQAALTNYFFTDAVTGGRNAMYFQIKGEELLKKRRNRENSYAVVNLVFVNFRNYVVSHSLKQGEKLLAKVYKIIDRNTHVKNERCAHMTSSTFAFVWHYVTREGFEKRLQGLLELLAKVDGNHRFSFQAGVRLIDRNEEQGKDRRDLDIDDEYNKACTAREVLADTDEPGISFFNEKIVMEQQWLNSVQEKQHKALENQEFVVYYQPKYDPRTNKLQGAEALIRWQSPELGFVTPFKFIPIFEKNGFITEIDHYMISHVAADQKRWLNAGFRCVPVSVNISRAHFIEDDLAEQIRDSVDATGCPHDLIEIELTESAFFDNKKAMIETINRLKNYGFAVSMDDFGAGYSSLNSLKDMPLDVLKLDADFFRGSSENGRGEIVVSEAIRLGKSLNMKIVAEGVEVREQVDFLASEGCDMIQGYYYAKPLPHEEFEQRMTQGENEQPDEGQTDKVQPDEGQTDKVQPDDEHTDEGQQEKQE